MKLIECVPNFSEGRDRGRVETIVAAMLTVPGVFLLDQELDHDHNRSVITIAGPPQAIAEAAVRGVGKAIELINLNEHKGAHPRLGAADVVPFVPLEGVTLEDCVALAHATGEEIWRRFQVPVYFYEASARAADRQNLENIRRGQFEGVREAVKTDVSRRPDVGGPELHPTAGATVVGARKFLIAFNVNLESTDLDAARQIARTVRASGGGLPAVKAMGVELKQLGCVQVSMNLTDFERTSLATAWQTVSAEAARRGIAVRASELIGLVPRRALENAAGELLRMQDFDPDRIVENRLATAMAGSGVRFQAQLQEFVSAIAAETPAPGGGSAAAASGALSAALGHMVASLSLKKKELQTWRDELHHLREEFARLQEEFLRATDRDADAYLAVRAAYGMPKETAADRQARTNLIRETTRRAAEVPLAVAVWARSCRDLLRQLDPISNPNLSSDLVTARALADAAFNGAAANVEINLASLPSDAEPGASEAMYLRSELERLRAMT
jgi:glutamate formiminotransferase/formiminotetrahydrofolate cyclodeaminase